MADQIKMNFALMEDMAQAFASGADALDDVISEVNNIASTLEDGGLIGDAGEALSVACRDSLVGSTAALKRKFLELQRDIQDAQDAMQEAEVEAAGLYR